MAATQKSFLIKNILFALCLYFFIKLFRGGGGGVIKYKSMGKMYQIFYQYSVFPLFLNLCVLWFN